MTPAVIQLIVGGGCAFAITFVASSPLDRCVERCMDRRSYSSLLQCSAAEPRTILPTDVATSPSMHACCFRCHKITVFACAIVDLQIQRSRADDMHLFVTFSSALFYLTSLYCRNSLCCLVAEYIVTHQKDNQVNV